MTQTLSLKHNSQPSSHKKNPSFRSFMSNPNLKDLDVQMKLAFAFGTDQSPITSPSIYAHSPTQLILYLNSMFIKYNIHDKKYTVFYDEAPTLSTYSSVNNETNDFMDEIKEQSNRNSNRNRTKIIITKFLSNGSNSLFMVVKKMQSSYYLSLFWPENGRTISSIKITENQNEVYMNCNFHSKKNYIYLLYKLINKDNESDHSSKNQYLKVIELAMHNHDTNISKQAKNHKAKTILNCLIKRTVGGMKDLDDFTINDDCNEIYFYGVDYFRQWKILFNQKSMRESNYRNIERGIQKQAIVNVFWIAENYFSFKSGPNSKVKGQQLDMNKIDKNTLGEPKQINNFLVIVAGKQILFVRKNQLLKVVPIPNESPFRRVHRETAEILLEKSLNQIYKTKFRVDNHAASEQDEDGEDKEENQSQIENKSSLVSASNMWIEIIKQSSDSKQNKVVSFCGSFDCSKTFTYKILSDFTIKIQRSINIAQNYDQWRNSANNNTQQNLLNNTIKNISSCGDGSLILFTDCKKQHFINNRSEDNENNDVDALYGCGHGHVSSIVSICSPSVSNYVVTVSLDGGLKIWNYSEKQKNLFIDVRFKSKPVQAIIHPCGFLLVVNFGLQIKVFAIVSTELEEIVSTKTSDFCQGIQFCSAGNFILANERNTIKLYDPFTLHILHKIQPEDMRLELKTVKISQNGEFIVFQCCNNKIYRKSLSSNQPNKSYFKAEENNTNFNSLSQFNDTKSTKSILCHKQSQEYTTFHYNFGVSKQNNSESNLTLSASNIFIGFSKSKFMSLYSNNGENLIAQFPVINDNYVVECCVTQHIMFLATNNGSILAYRWPILQSHLQLQIMQSTTPQGNKIAHFKPPKPIRQFIAFRDNSPITTMKKISNKHELVIGGINGLVGFVEYSLFKNGGEFFDTQGIVGMNNQRKKMITAMNNLKFMKISDIDKVLKLIEKTQNDIQKIDYEIHNEKERKNQELAREEQELENNAQKRKKAYIDERNEKFIDQEKELKFHEIQFMNKKKQFQNVKTVLTTNFNQKVQYEKTRIQQIKQNIDKQKKQYKQRVLDLIEHHKQSIRTVKQNNVKYIKSLQSQFETTIKQNFKENEEIVQIRQVEIEKNFKDETAFVQILKVQELQTDITKKQKQFQKISVKADQAKKEDQEIQRSFESNLEKYNTYRYENIMLHSQLLKMQTQLHERKQILDKKDEIIKIIFHEKKINETYKQFVSGTINNLETQKQKAYIEYVNKQKDLRMLFEQLTMEINKSEEKKLKKGQLKHAIKIYERQCQQIEQNIRISVDKLKNLKKYLLVQGVSQDSEQKRIYQEQQKLLTSIRWLQKRFRMSCVNEKKLTVLKKSHLNQIINQNKNLLQECNQLRQQGLVYNNQIDHLSRKLAEANKIIELQKKLKNQNNSLSKQTQQLQQIRNLFKDQLNRASMEDQNEGVEF